MHARQPVVCGRWADPRVAENIGVTQGVHVGPILFDPCVYLISCADGPVTGDDDIDLARHALEQPQRGEVVLNRVRGVVEVKQRNQNVRKRVAGDKNAALLDQQRRMARGMRLMLDDLDLRAIPRNLRSLDGRRYYRELLSGSEERIASNILVDRLKRLTDAGMLTRDPARSGQRARYNLTEPAIQLVPVFAQLGSWGLRHRPTSHCLRVRAQLLEQGGPELWESFMAELRHEHLGSEPPLAVPTIREQLRAAYLTAAEQDENR
jgi:DNA-binding HxlR family transcriptional regulator